MSTDTRTGEGLPEAARSGDEGALTERRSRPGGNREEFARVTGAAG